MNRYLIFTLMVMALILPPSASWAADRALVIGIDNYPFVGSLRGAVNDAKDIAKALESIFGLDSSAIRMLTDGNADRQGILSSVEEWLINGTQKGDRVFFTYSGHGYYIKDQPGGDESGSSGDGFDEIMVTHDTQFDPSTGKWINYITDDEMGSMLKQIPDRHLFVLFDSCHSGTMTRALVDVANFNGKFPIPKHRPQQFQEPLLKSRGSLLAHQKETNFFKAQPGMVALFAVAPNQVAFEDDENPDRVVGLFTSRFIKGVKEKQADINSDGRVVFAELMEYIQAESTAFCRRHPKGCKAGLTPQLEAPPTMLARDVVAFENPVLNEENTTPSNPSPSSPSEIPPPSLPQTVEALLAHGNTADLALTISPRTKVREGEEMAFKVKTKRPGQLILFDIDTNQEMTLLYPNQYSQDGPGVDPNRPMGHIRANVNVLVPDDFTPFRFTASPPYGTGRVVAVLIEDKINIGSVFSEGRDIEVVPRPQQWLVELRAGLNQNYHEENGFNRAVNWSVTWADYTISP